MYKLHVITHASLLENSPLSSLPLVMTSVLEKILLPGDCVGTARGLMLERLQEILLMISISMSFILY